MQGMPEETCVVSPGELQPLLHSSSDTAVRRRVVEAVEGSCTIDMEPECDTDSNKTEVEEIEMVDMEGRDTANTDMETEAELETHQDWDGLMA